MAKKIVHSENEQLNDRPKMNCRRLNLILPVFIIYNRTNFPVSLFLRKFLLALLFPWILLLAWLGNRIIGHFSTEKSQDFS